MRCRSRFSFPLAMGFICILRRRVNVAFYLSYVSLCLLNHGHQLNQTTRKKKTTTTAHTEKIIHARLWCFCLFLWIWLNGGKRVVVYDRFVWFVINLFLILFSCVFVAQVGGARIRVSFTRCDSKFDTIEINRLTTKTTNLRAHNKLNETLDSNMRACVCVFVFMTLNI